MARKKENWFSWKNWWKGLVLVLLINVVVLLYTSIIKIFTLPVVVLISIAGIIFIPIIYSLIVKNLY